jgi:hypothetical protein
MDLMMKNVRHALLLILGCCFILLAVFAFKLGLDLNPSWGKSRVIAFSLGALLIAVFVDSHFGKAWVDNAMWQITTWLADIHEKIFNRLHIPSKINPRIRNGFIYCSVILVFLAVTSIYVWFTSAGTWKTLPKSTDYYNLLANAFVHGHVALDVEVPSQLLALPDPYEYKSRNGMTYLWDASLYKGRYYLYWGPMPAVIVAAIKLAHPMDVGDQVLTLVFATGLLFFQTLLITTIWMRSFQQLPVWTLLLGILLAGLVAPVTYLLNTPDVYEAAILGAQAFLIGGIFFAYLAFSEEKIAPKWLALASVFWVCAIASRAVVICAVAFLVFYILICILRQYGLAWTRHFNSLILALGLPMVLGAIALGWYNFARFGSVLEFGHRYQLTSYNNYKYESLMFSSRYIPANINNYLFNPPEKIRPFPYYRAKIGNETEAFGSLVPELYNTEPVTGIIYVLPFAVFAFIPVLQTAIKRIRDGKNINETGQSTDWINLILTGATLSAVIAFLMFFSSAMRYVADATSMLIVLAIIGFWIGYQAVKSDTFVRFVYSGIGILLAGISIVFPNMLALLSSQKIIFYSPQAFPTLEAFLKLLF